MASTSLLHTGYLQAVLLGNTSRKQWQTVKETLTVSQPKLIQNAEQITLSSSTAVPYHQQLPGTSVFVSKEVGISRFLTLAVAADEASLLQAVVVVPLPVLNVHLHTLLSASSRVEYLIGFSRGPVHKTKR